MYGLLEAGQLANGLLKQQLKPSWYYELPHTARLWKHTTGPIQFKIVVDGFGLKYVEIEHAKHLLHVLQK